MKTLAHPRGTTKPRILQVVTQLERAGAQTLAAWLDEVLKSTAEVETVFLYKKYASEYFDSSVCIAQARPEGIIGWARVFKSFHSRVSKSDIILAHTHYAMVFGVLALAARWPRKKLIVVHHWPEAKYPMVAQVALLIGRALRVVTREVYVAPPTAPRTGAVVIPNPVPTLDGAPTTSVTKDIDLLVVARHSTEKMLSTAIEALAHLPGRTLTLVGQGPLTEQLHRLAISKGVADRVEWLGALSRTEVLGAMRRCRALALPSAWEALPMVLLEGVATETSMVVSDIDAHKFLLSAGAAIGFAPGNAAAMAAAIQQVGDAPTRAALEDAMRRLKVSMGEGGIAERWNQLKNGLQK